MTPADPPARIQCHRYPAPPYTWVLEETSLGAPVLPQSSHELTTITPTTRHPTPDSHSPTSASSLLHALPHSCNFRYNFRSRGWWVFGWRRVEQDSGSHGGHGSHGGGLEHGSGDEYRGAPRRDPLLLLRRAPPAGARGEPQECVRHRGHVGGAGGSAVAVSGQWLLGPAECVGGESLSGIFFSLADTNCLPILSWFVSFCFLLDYFEIASKFELGVQLSGTGPCSVLFLLLVDFFVIFFRG